jgi:hypothetical protein
VTPIDNKVIPNAYGGDWPGRWVKAIEITENQVEYSIPFESTDWKNMPFSNVHKNLIYRDGSIRGIANNQQLSNEQLDKLQSNIWDNFQRCMEKIRL